MSVPPNITQTAGDNQQVENHHRYDCEWNQVLNTYLLSGFDNLVIFPAQSSARRLGVGLFFATLDPVPAVSIVPMPPVMDLDWPVRLPPPLTSFIGFRSRTLMPFLTRRRQVEPITSMSFLTRRQRERITSMFGILVFTPKWTWQANSSRVRISEIAGRLGIGRRSHPGQRRRATV